MNVINHAVALVLIRIYELLSIGGKITVWILPLAVAMIPISIYADANHAHWINSHPLTTNLIAGLLGLPAAFLIVNLAAQQALNFYEATKWAKLRLAEADDIINEWRNARNHFSDRYSIAPTDRLSTALTQLIDLIDQGNTSPQLQSSSASRDQLRDLLEIVQSARTRQSEKVTAEKEEELRRHLQDRLLPRLKSAGNDPDTMIKAREVSDLLMELDTAIERLDGHWISHVDLLSRLSAADTTEKREYLVSFKEVTDKADKTLKALADLTNYLSQYRPRATQRRLERLKKLLGSPEPEISQSST
jgi:hypothetical protein